MTVHDDPLCQNLEGEVGRLKAEVARLKEDVRIAEECAIDSRMQAGAALARERRLRKALKMVQKAGMDGLSNYGWAVIFNAVNAALADGLKEE